jgi:sec-independent protein translocase protein TatC
MEIWKFISPAFYKNERKMQRHSSFFFFFFIGVLFGYYIVIPMSTLLLPLKEWSSPQSVYIRLLYWVGKTSVLASGYFFELPIIIYFWQNWWPCVFKNLSQIRYCTCSCRGCHRKPDVVSQTIVAIPMLLIYEASIFISVLVTKNKKKNNYECYYWRI